MMAVVLDLAAHTDSIFRECGSLFGWAFYVGGCMCDQRLLPGLARGVCGTQIVLRMPIMWF